MKRDLLKKYNISDDEFKFIEETIMEAFPHHAGPQWKFAGAFYFATVVMAMIGPWKLCNCAMQPYLHYLDN